MAKCGFCQEEHARNDLLLIWHWPRGEYGKIVLSANICARCVKAIQRRVEKDTKK